MWPYFKHCNLQTFQRMLLCFHKIKFNHLRGLRWRKWHFSLAHDKVPKISGQSPCSEMIYPSPPPQSLWTLKDCPWPTAFPSLMPFTHASSRPTKLVLGTASFISRKLLLKRKRSLLSRKKRKHCFSILRNRQDRGSLLRVLERTSCYHTATLLAWDEAARPPKEN